MKRKARVYITWFDCVGIKKDIQELINEYPEYKTILNEAIDQIKNGQQFGEVKFHRFQMEIESPYPSWKSFRVSSGLIELSIY